MKSRLLAITLAVVLAVVGVVAVLAYVRQANDRAVNGLRAQTVMFAVSAIPAGTSLSTAQQDGMLSTEKVPDSSLTGTAVRSVTAANKRLVVSGTVAKGQVLLQNMLATASKAAASGSFNIPAGMVAVTMNMCVAEAVAAYVTPGSDVAIFDTFGGTATGLSRTCDTDHQVLSPGAQALTELVLGSAQVLAVGQDPASPGATDGSNASVTTDPSASSSVSSLGEVLVTLAVTPVNAERLILIAEVGLPYMALLGPNSNVGQPPPVVLFPTQLPSQQ